MTLRAAIYARYSSDQQQATSIEDQFRICQELADREGWKISGSYRDAAISGASMFLRNGIQSLLEDARRGLFDVVVAEALDRMSRDQADVAALYKHLQFSGVVVVTQAEGEINELHIGLKGTMNALFLKDLAAKTRRGLRGRVELGKSGGGICYGYEVVKTLNAAGEPVRGGRQIKQKEADIVRRIFREFARGTSPRAIARRLNEDGISTPSGKPWTDSAIRGHQKRGTGIINNELYIGRLVWNRQRFIKNPDTGRRVARINPPEEWIVTEVPELRIVDDALWQEAKSRQKALSEKYAAVIAASSAVNGLNRMQRPRHLLSGLLECSVCGGSYSIAQRDQYHCSTNKTSGTCSNGRGIRRTNLEERVLAGLKDRLMSPKAAEQAIRAYTEETNRLNWERRAASAADQKELAEIKKKMKNMITIIEDGGYVDGMIDRLKEMERRQKELEAHLSAAPADVPDIHPRVADIYRRRVEQLAESLANPDDRDKAAEAIRGLIKRIVISPGKKRGEMDITLCGDLGNIIQWVANNTGERMKGVPVTPQSGVTVSVVAGAGFEPTTFGL